MENLQKENFMALNVEGKHPYNAYIIFNRKDRISERLQNIVLNSQQYNQQISADEAINEKSCTSTYDRKTNKTRWWKYVLGKDIFPYGEDNFNVYISQKIKGNEIIVGLASCEPEMITEVDVNPLFSKSGACKALAYWSSLAMFHLGYKKLKIGILSTNYISACICYLNGVSKIWKRVRLNGSKEKLLERKEDKDNKNAFQKCSDETILSMVFYLI